LNLETVGELKKARNYNEMLCIQAQLLLIDDCVAQKGNSFGFTAGVNFHLCHVYPLLK
jgi:hypothetical protein